MAYRTEGLIVKRAYPLRGETHHRALLTDDDVDAIRDLYEEDRFKPRGTRFWTPRRLAEKYEISVRYVKRIVQYEVRLAPEG